MKVVYEEVPGWKEDITKARSLEDLPAETRSFIARVEELTGCAVDGFSVGPDRAQTIISGEPVKQFAKV